MPETLILSSSGAGAIVDANTIVVATLLDAIARLERRPITKVVLAGSYARSEELASSLAELYPSITLEHEV